MTLAASKETEERQARIASLRERFNNVPSIAGKSSSMPMATADHTKVVTTIADTVGVNKAFLIRDLTEDIKTKLCTGFGITVSEGMTAHQVSQALASAMRRAKEVEIDYNKSKVVLMNEPGEGTRPSKWAVFANS